MALGDSLTEGIGERVGGGWRGWAALLAPSLGAEPARFTDLAVSGARTREVLERQLPAALALRPGLVSVVVGVSDPMRRTRRVVVGRPGLRTGALLRLAAARTGPRSARPRGAVSRKSA
ncbi:hypothetical protein GCM10010294_10770 [Streptomyces griseoloalbus]|nr:hypothetical protein GCM10010294_10770 [Streptomyces griseoloalbus]